MCCSEIFGKRKLLIGGRGRNDCRTENGGNLSHLIGEWQGVCSGTNLDRKAAYSASPLR